MVSGGGLPSGLLGRRRPAKPILPRDHPAQDPEAPQKLPEPREEGGGLSFSSPAFAGEADHPRNGWWRGDLVDSKNPSTAFGGPPPREIAGRKSRPAPSPLLPESH